MLIQTLRESQLLVLFQFHVRTVETLILSSNKITQGQEFNNNNKNNNNNNNNNNTNDIYIYIYIYIV